MGLTKLKIKIQSCSNFYILCYISALKKDYNSLLNLPVAILYVVIHYICETKKSHCGNFVSYYGKELYSPQFK